jgi:hypothetical protein
MVDMNEIVRERLEGSVAVGRELIEQERQMADEHRKEKARRAYIDAGGSEDGFTKQWPEIRERLLADKTVEAMKSRR